MPAGAAAKAAAAARAKSEATPKKSAKQRKAEKAKAKAKAAAARAKDVPDPSSAAAVQAAATVAGLVGLASIPGVNCYTSGTVHVNSGCLHTCDVWQADTAYNHRRTALPVAQASTVLPTGTSPALPGAQANAGLPTGTSQVHTELPDVPKHARRNLKKSIGALMRTTGFSIFAMLSCVSDIVLSWIQHFRGSLSLRKMFPKARPSKAMPPFRYHRVWQRRLLTH